MKSAIRANVASSAPGAHGAKQITYAHRCTNPVRNCRSAPDHIRSRWSAVTAPSATNHRRYDELFDVYRAAQQQLVAVNHQLHQITAEGKHQ